MAVLKQLPSQAIISALKGTVDFYLWKGLPCARAWPHWPKRVPYPTEKAAQDRFAYAAKAWALLPEYLKEMYRQMVAGTDFTARDMFTRLYLTGNRVILLPD